MLKSRVALLLLPALTAPVGAAEATDAHIGKPAEYDYVVIGGGTAGLAIASRLSTVASVAVIEAGGFYEQDNGNLSTVPTLALSIGFIDTSPAYPRNPLMDWDYLTVPQRNAGNRTIHYAQGKTLGGSSAINTLAYHRGTVGTYQKWADVVGDQSYTYPNVLPFFKKSSRLWPPDFAKRATPNATFTYDPTAFNEAKPGPLQVSWSPWVDPTITWLAQGIYSLLLPDSSAGFNSGILSGYGAYVTTTVNPTNATRSSSRTSYMETIGVPAGLKVYHHTRARKIIFRGQRADGVSVRTNSTDYILTARKEVILSAGAFGSPHLLMVSGVGPAEVLRQYNVSVVANRPGVGQNLWDQIFFPIINAVNTPSGPEDIVKDPETANKQYYEQRWGPLSGKPAYLAFEKIPSSFRDAFSQTTRDALEWFPTDWPEIEYIAGSSADANGDSLGILGTCLTAPVSRGSVTIRSSDPSIPPVIDPGWLTNAADAEVALAGFKRARQAWRNVSSIKVGPEIAPGDAVQTDAQILEYISNTATQIWHAGSTCAMGKASDENAVVDSEAKVIGVEGLRVVDASAFPFMVPGHPQSSVYMLAEKIADRIVKEAKGGRSG